MEIIKNQKAFSWKGKTVFVTGATGLLGSSLVPNLVRRGAEVVALIRDGRPQSQLVQDGWLDRITTVHGSLPNHNDLKTMAVDRPAIFPVYVVASIQ